MILPRKPFTMALVATVAAAGLSVWDNHQAGAAIDESWLLNTVQNHEQRISSLETQVGKNSTDIATLQAATPSSAPAVQQTAPVLTDQATAATWTPSATPVPTPAATPAPSPKPTVTSWYWCHIPGQNADEQWYNYSDGTSGAGNTTSVPAHQPYYQDCPSS